jgi:hypothetical protein
LSAKAAIIQAFQGQPVVDHDREMLYAMSHEEIAEIAAEAALKTIRDYYARS